MGLSKDSIIFIAVILVVSITIFVGAQPAAEPNPGGILPDAVFHTVDALEQGPGSGLDADYLDNMDSSDFVLSSGGSGQAKNAVYLLALGTIIADESRTSITVDDSGNFIMDNTFDEEHGNQVAYVVPVSMPSEIPYGKSLRLIVDVSQMDNYNSYNNDFCYEPVDHGFEGGSDKKSCTRRWYKKGSWKYDDKTPEDYFWIETSPEKGLLSDYLEGFGKDCTVIHTTRKDAVNPYVEKEAGLVCHIDLNEPVNSIAINTADWDDGTGNWDFKIYYTFIDY